MTTDSGVLEALEALVSQRPAPPEYRERTLTTRCPDGHIVQTIWPPTWKWVPGNQERHADIHRRAVLKYLRSKDTP